MALNFTGFKQKLFSLMKVNETEDKAYQLSYAGGNSGYSYGWVQFDLASGPNIGRDKFETILKNATDSNGNKIIPADQQKTLFDAAQTTGGTGLTSEQIALIDAALSSDYGKTAIDDATSEHLDNLITYADSWVTKAPADDKIFLQSDLGKLWLCDVKNQGFVPVTSKPQEFESFLQGQAYRGYTKQGALSFDDILEVYFRQRQAVNFVPWDPFRRLANVVEAAGGYTPSSLEEAKGILRAYTYYYVRNENVLVQSQTYLDSVNAFRNKVNAPAEQMILDNWKPEWGTCPSLSNIDDILMGDDNANMSDSGDYQLNGRDGNDIIFGEGGNDQIKGGKGDDILLGGKGVDKLYGGDEVDHLYGDENNDYLYGEGENDFIYGGAGDDKITGGAGNDYLEGGADNDTYYINAGEGVDTIEDKEGSNHVVINGTSYEGTSYTEIIKVLIEQTDGTYKTLDGKIKGVKENTDMVLYDAATGEKLAILNENFQDGDFGIHLLDTPDNTVTANTIVGDQDPNNLNDIIYDSFLNDRIEGGVGNDTIMAYGGGADWILGGDGRDAISALTGDDTAEGNAGADIVFGGIGDDQLFGGNYGKLGDLMAQGQTAPNIAARGDLVSGNTGDDFIYGSNAKDALFGGEIILRRAA